MLINLGETLSDISTLQVAALLLNQQEGIMADLPGVSISYLPWKLLDN